MKNVIQEQKDLLRKVRKLLAIAERSTNEHEAQSALLRVQALMVEHRLSRSDIEHGEAPERGEKAVTQTEADRPYQQFPTWKLQLAGVIAHNFRCVAIRTRQGEQHLSFIGLTVDVTLATETYSAAARAAEALSRAYVKTRVRAYRVSPGIGQRLAASFRLGFVQSLHQRFAEQVTTHQWALVLVRDEVVDEAVQSLGKIKEFKARRSRQQDNEALLAGYDAGRRFEGTNTKAISQPDTLRVANSSAKQISLL